MLQCIKSVCVARIEGIGSARLGSVIQNERGSAAEILIHLDLAHVKTSNYCIRIDSWVVNEDMSAKVLHNF